jgi:hypothetical protein
MTRLWLALCRWWDQSRIKVGTRVGTPKGFGTVVVIDRGNGRDYLVVNHGERGVYMHLRSSCWRV